MSFIVFYFIVFLFLEKKTLHENTFCLINFFWIFLHFEINKPCNSRKFLDIFKLVSRQLWKNPTCFKLDFRTIWLSPKKFWPTPKKLWHTPKKLWPTPKTIWPTPKYIWHTSNKFDPRTHKGTPLTLTHHPRFLANSKIMGRLVEKTFYFFLFIFFGWKNSILNSTVLW